MTDTSAAFETGTLKSRDGTELFYRLLPRDDAQASLVFVHGFGEHSGRYEHVMRRFHDAGYDTAAFDYRGHGKAGGKRAYCERFSRFDEDLDTFLRFVMERGGADRKVFLVGHSHGGLVSMSYVLDHPEGIDGVVLSCPFFGVKMKVPAIKVAAGKLMSVVWPGLELPTGIPPEHLSTDPAVGQAYEADPLVGKVATARWYTEATKRQQQLLDSADQIRMPVLLLQAGDDKIADGDINQNLLAAIGSADKEMKWYPGMYHEIFNEVDKEEVFSDLEAWLKSHV